MAAAIVLIAGVYVLTSPTARASAVVLVPYHTVYSISGGQLNAVDFTIQTTSVVNGTFTNTLGIIVYIFTPEELVNLTLKGQVTGYQWTSGVIANLTVDSIDVTVTPGAWDLTFVNPNLFNTTIVGFWSNVTLSPS